MANDINSFNTALQEFCEEVDEVQTAALISQDGLPIASYSETGLDADSISALVASFHHLSETTLKEFNKAKSNEVIVTSDTGLILMINLHEDDLVLYIHANDYRKTGYILYRSREFQKVLKALFD